jgi:23S rRNA (cytosine1962-C5)-methyltransferase
MKYKKVILNSLKDRPIRNRHHWIFSGAIKSAPNFEDGEILEVYSVDNDLLGHGYFNHKTTIAGRMLNFDSQDPIDALKENIKNAIKLRKTLFGDSTNAYRVINGEGDYIPGLIVDKYDEVLVVQIATVGMDKLKDIIVKVLKDELNPKCIYEKSNMQARVKDGLKALEGTIYGTLPEKIIVKENDIKFIVDIYKSQKTGLFLDMREMRNLVGEMSHNKTVLNCFSYTGGFSLYAMKGSAKSVDSVDIAADAVKFAQDNFEINKFETKNSNFIAKDAFVFLREESLDYDFIILDPPAFAKKRDDIERAKRGYGEINRTTLKKMPPKSYLLTCSCSYHVNQEMFEDIISKAAREARRSVRILHKQRLAMDHPINIHHSEIDYLKSLLLYVE